MSFERVLGRLGAQHGAKKKQRPHGQTLKNAGLNAVSPTLYGGQKKLHKKASQAKMAG